MKNFRLLSIASFLMISVTAEARGGSGLQIGLEPIIGYERVQKLVPTTHTTDRLLYGARITAGFKLLSLEAQYTTAKDTESFSNPDLTVTDTGQKAKVGLRSTLGSGMMKLVARGGVQGFQTRHQESSGGVSTVDTTVPLVYKPYGGAGLKFRLSSQISFTAEVVAIFKKFPDMNQNEYETTAGFEIHI